MNRLSSLSRKTSTILCVAGGLVAAAVILGRQHRSAASGPGASHGPVLPAPVIHDACIDAGGKPARATIDFGKGTMTAALSAGRVLATTDGDIYVAIDLSTRDARAEKRMPLNLAIVIDHSGSMQGEKIEKARAAARGMVERLGPEDRVAIVQFDDSAQVLAQSTRVDAEGKARLMRAIDGIVDGGGTNIGGGLTLGRDEVLKSLADAHVSRVLLLSDGQANVGIVDPAGLTGIASNAADRGIHVTTVGLGLDYNEDLMQALAETGRGEYYYVRDAISLDAVFAGELKAMQSTVATRTELRLEPACAGVEIREVYGYPSRKEGAGVVVPLADLSGNETRKVVVRLHVPTGTTGGEGVLDASLAYADPSDAAGAPAKVSTVSLGVEVTADRDAVNASLDKGVLGKVEQAEGSVTLRKATEAYDRGDRAGAQRMIREQEDKTRAHAQAFALPAAATAPMLDELDGVATGVGSFAPGSEAGKDLVKGGKKSAQMMAH